MTKSRYNEFILKKIEKDSEFIEYNSRLKERKLIAEKGAKYSKGVALAFFIGTIGLFFPYMRLENKLKK